MITKGLPLPTRTQCKGRELATQIFVKSLFSSATLIITKGLPLPRRIQCNVRELAISNITGCTVSDDDKFCLKLVKLGCY